MNQRSASNTADSIEWKEKFTLPFQFVVLRRQFLDVDEPFLFLFWSHCFGSGLCSNVKRSVSILLKFDSLAVGRPDRSQTRRCK